MSRILLVEDTASLAELFAGEVESRFGDSVRVCMAVEDVELALADGPFDLAIADLSFSHENASGLDALATVHHASPGTVLSIMTQVDGHVADVLRDAWDLLPIATVISKTAPLDFQLQTINEVVATGFAPVNPAIQPLLPARRDPTRRERFGHLVQRQRHAKVWRVLIDCRVEATHKHLAASSGFELNTIKNYRTQLVPELELHGLQEPTLREMQDFAWRCGAFSRPYVDAPFGRPAA